MTGPRLTARAVAFVLPQFHPIAENDEWWGKGFTEWTNVVSSRPSFPGHHQPVLPADLGFYDLRLPEARSAQADLARLAGIEAFCYWHYWFEGRRLLERPVEDLLTIGEPNFPFCLAWANESWSRRWLGEERDVLMPQTYSANDDHEHAEYLARVFQDERYLTVDRRPVFLLYRPTFHEDARRFVDELKASCRRAQVPEPYLIAINAHARNADYRALGFDHVLDFQPQLSVLRHVGFEGWSPTRLLRNVSMGVMSGRARVYRESYARRVFASTRPRSADVPCVFVGWDTTPRRGRQAVVIKSAGAASYQAALSAAVRGVSQKPEAERLVFVNAWNEWAEGNHLEPSTAGGHSYLAASRRVLMSV